MIIALFLISGLLLLYLGASLLIKGSANIALRAGVPSLIVGLTIVAYGTSSPELLVSIRAGLEGFGDISVGNVVGSNIFNIVVILGISAMISPLKVNRQVLKTDTPILILASAVFFLLLWDKEISRIEGLILISGIIIYTVFTIYSGKKDPSRYKSESQDQEKGTHKINIWIEAGRIILGLTGLIAGSQLFIRGATDLAKAFSIPEAVIGLTIVAAGTSLPELATSVLAVIKRENDIAIGNVVGSNIFNLLAIIGISGTISPLKTGGIGIIDLILMNATALLLLPLMRSGFRIIRIEGFLLILIYIVYLYFLWP